MTKLLYTNLKTPSTRPTLPTVIYYVRNSGNDNNPGTLALPLATLKAALDKVPTIIDDAHYVIDLSTYQQINSEAFYGPPKVSSLPADLQFVGQWLQDATLSPLTLTAEPTVFATLAVTGQTNDAVTTLLTIATTNNFALNQLQGKFVRGSVLGEWGVVVSNTAGPNSSIFVSTSAPFTGPVEILDLSCELALGDITDFFNRTNTFMMPACAVAFTGIKLSNANSNANVALWMSGMQFNFEFCEIEGLYQEAGFSRFDACFFNGGLLSANGHANAIYQSYLRNVDIQFHGEGGVGGQGYYWTVAEGCTPLGHYNNFQSAGGFDIGESEIKSPKVDGNPAGAATIGVYYRGGAHARVRNTKIGGATQAILCEGPGYLLAANVQNGAVANTDVGCDLDEGGRAVNSGSGVSGAAGQVRVGAAGIVTWPTPTTDPVQLCRLS